MAVAIINRRFECLNLSDINTPPSPISHNLKPNPRNLQYTKRYHHIRRTNQQVSNGTPFAFETSWWNEHLLISLHLQVCMDNMSEVAANKNMGCKSLDEVIVLDEKTNAKKPANKAKLGIKRKTTYKPKPFVWQHFTKIIPLDGTLWSEATCNHCKLVFHCPSDNGTSTLRRHLPKCPKYEKNKDPNQPV